MSDRDDEFDDIALRGAGNSIILQFLKHVLRECRDLNAKFDDLRQYLFGNGNPTGSVAYELAELKREMKGLREQLAERAAVDRALDVEDRRGRWAMRAGWVGCAGTMLGIVLPKAWEVIEAWLK